MLLRRFEYPNTTGLILRRTYPELYKSHIIKLFEEFPQTRAWWNESRKELSLPKGSRLFFGSAEHEKDMAAYYSAEFADIMVDEAQEFSQGELEKLTGSNRCTSNRDIVPKMVYTFMPGLSEAGLPPKGLNYLKRVFVDSQIRGDEQRHNWAFLQAFAWDNVEWARKQLEQEGLGERDFYSWPAEQRRDYFIDKTEFGKVLASLTDPQLRDAWLNGKWNVFQGQYFKNWAYEKDTIADEDIKHERWYKRWISGDWGDDHPAVYYWHQQDEHGNITTYREWWSRGAGEAEMGRKITELSEGEKLCDFFLSWDAFGKLNRDTRKSITEMIGNSLGPGLPRPTPADASAGSRISGWRLMSQLIDAGQWKVARSCEKLIECIPTLVRDMQRNSEDVLKVDYSDSYIGDDPADAARYGLQNMISSARLPLEERIENRMAKAIQAEPEATDTQLMMYRAKVQAEEKRTNKPMPMKRKPWLLHR